MQHVQKQRLQLKVILLILTLHSGIARGQNAGNVYSVPKTTHFEPDGKGSAAQWQQAKWLSLPPRKIPNDKRGTRVKGLYSDKGLYFLFECDDTEITSTMNADFLDLWKEDVVEVFIHPDTSAPAYFEYELSPRNFELPILISNVDRTLHRWMPFHYENDRRTLHRTSIMETNGSGKPAVRWTAEFFIPYTLLLPLKNHIPASGARWKGNFYRVDYDNSQYSSWVWQPTSGSFHDMERFGYFIFE